MNSGWATRKIFYGFPRVFFGFTCGMLLYHLRSYSSKNSVLNCLQSMKEIPFWMLYAALITTLTLPIYLQGFYSVFAVTIISPILVMFGAKYTNSSSAVNRISEFLGWLSYPLYCLHVPVRTAVRQVGNHFDFLSLFGVTYTEISIVVTLTVAIVSALLFDKLLVQKKLANLLQRVINYILPTRAF